MQINRLKASFPDNWEVAYFDILNGGIMKLKNVTARIPSGFLELLPKDQIVFNNMFEQIREVFERFGFLPIETPAVELKEVLLAKGGGETEKQVYRLSAKSGETDMCLHFDLTVPLARYVVQHMNDLTFPFRRYQMQKVWRGEGAQKGRYREFYQCDIDVIGTFNPLTDAEIPSVIYEVFQQLKIPKFTIKLNNRKFVCGIFKALCPESLISGFFRIADKLPKIGKEAGMSELLALGISEKDTDFLIRMLSFNGTYSELEIRFPDWKNASQLVRDGFRELSEVYEGILSFGVPTEYIQIDLGIVRGLDYYTGSVYETTLDDYPSIGSICSGGRYDDLCGYYTDRVLPGVGISIGLSRLFFQLKDAGLISYQNLSTASVLVVSAEKSSMPFCMETASQLRQAGINSEIYLEEAKLNKQLKYADSLGIPFVIIIGSSEIESGTISLKDMSSQIQENISLEVAICKIVESSNLPRKDRREYDN